MNFMISLVSNREMKSDAILWLWLWMEMVK